MTRLCPLALLGLLAGCAHAPAVDAGASRSRVETHGFYYSDEAGLRVLTMGASGSHQPTRKLDVAVQVLADQVVIDPPPPPAPRVNDGAQPTGHRHPGVDVVSSASVIAVGESPRTEEWRFEGMGIATWRDQWRGAPARWTAVARGSTEPDYRSLSGRLQGELSLFEQNTDVGAFVGFGHDTIDPLTAPPGQDALWPGTHDRLTVGASVSQLLSPRLVARGGVGGTHQWGRLSSPYRRARVQSTLFPEVVPGARDRLTAFLALSWHLGGGTALHLRQGGYLDTWGVGALIPEAALAKEVGRSGMVSLRYRLYQQSGATFYAPVYATKAALLSGDPRLGALTEHVGAVEVQWAPVGKLGWSDALTLAAGYELSALSYRQLNSTVRANIFSLRMTWGF